MNLRFVIVIYTRFARQSYYIVISSLNNFAVRQIQINLYFPLFRSLYRILIKDRASNISAIFCLSNFIIWDNEGFVMYNRVILQDSSLNSSLHPSLNRTVTVLLTAAYEFFLPDISALLSLLSVAAYKVPPACFLLPHKVWFVLNIDFSYYFSSLAAYYDIHK